MVEKTSQREGKTSVNLDQLATKLGFKAPEDLYSVVAKEEFSLRNIEQALYETPPAEPEIGSARAVQKRSSGQSVAHGASTGVLVVGVDALLTQLARVAVPRRPIHSRLRHARQGHVHTPYRLCDVPAHVAALARTRAQTAWSGDVMSGRGSSVSPVGTAVESNDRQGLLRDISEVFAREKINVIGVKSQSRRNVAYMQFTVEVSSAAQIQRACTILGEVQGVMKAMRR